jgi:hypothetical protein
MSNWQELAQFMCGDVRYDRGFWYSHPLWEINGLIGRIQLLRALVEAKRERAC